jgi:hypothetical protein
MSTKRFNARHKTRNDLIDPITPMVFQSGPDTHPYGPFAPAPWLPIQWQDVKSQDYFVIASGKVVCLTTAEGWVVPAGVRNDFVAGTGITYTSDDFDNKTMDITTGEEYVVDGTTTYTATNVRDALRERGLITAAATLETYLSLPVGAIFGDQYAWAGGNGWNPAHLKFANYQKSKGCQFVTRHQMILPLVPASHSAVSVPGSLTGAEPAFGGGTIHTAANTKLRTRYADIVNTNFVGWFLADFPIAGDTDRTPIVGSSSDFLAREIKADLATYGTHQEAIAAAVDRLTTAGDYFIDYEVGGVFMYSSGGTAIPANATGETLSYYWYGAAPGSVQRFACAIGDLKPGDFVKTDADSNYVKFVVGTDDEEQKIGRIVSSVHEPRDLLEYVKTAFSGDQFNAYQQMGGSASKGYSSMITYSNAADKAIRLILNVK